MTWRLMTKAIAATTMMFLCSGAVNAATPAKNANSNGGGNQGERKVKVAINIDGRRIVAELEDNATSRDFVSQLPLTLKFEDYHATEKVSYLPRTLSTSGAPDGFDPSVGTVAYYAPWGNLAIFYKDFGYSRSLINLGRIVSGLDILAKTSSFNAKIERVEGE